MYTKLTILLGYVCILPIISIYTNNILKEILLYLHALTVPCIIYIFLTDSSTEKNELYGQRHIICNLDVPPKTFWFNMGLWDKPDLTFPQACENLVHAVAKAMNLKPASTVLDVGFGCGDSCIVLAEQYKSKVTGITNELRQWHIATNRISSTQQDQIKLIHGSADDLAQHISTTFDYITCIDSAYHYNTRWNFLKTAFSYLKPTGGTIGLYDLCIDNSLSHHPQILKWVCQGAQVPVINLVTIDEYEKRLSDIGYKNIQIIRLNPSDVFGGLSKSFDAQYNTLKKYGIGSSLANKAFLKISSFMFGILEIKPWLIPVIVKAEKLE